jgi:homotetrameric cytidine deaminase
MPIPSNPTTHTPISADQFMAAAVDAAAHAYAPYSGFRVGAALLLASGHLVTGANVENVSFGLTLCAERAALVRAVAEFGPEIRIAAVAVANLNHAASPPCGACRQVLAEFCSHDALVSFPTADSFGSIQTHTCTFGEILPFNFHLPSSFR